MTWSSRSTSAPARSETFLGRISLLGNAGPGGGGGERSLVAREARRLRRPQPDAVEYSDQRYAKSQPQFHARLPLPHRRRPARPGRRRDRLSQLCPLLGRKSIGLRQPVEAFAKPPGKIVDPALAAQPSPLADLLHRHPQNQDLMHQRRAVGACLLYTSDAADDLLCVDL